MTGKCFNLDFMYSRFKVEKLNSACVQDGQKRKR